MDPEDNIKIFDHFIFGSQYQIVRTVTYFIVRGVFDASIFLVTLLEPRATS